MTNLMIDAVLALLAVILIVLAYILGFLTASDKNSADEHRAYLQGYKDCQRDERRRRHGDNNNLRQM